MGLALAAGTAVAILASSGAPGPGSAGVQSAFRPAVQITTLSSAGRRSLATRSWWGHVYTAATGETVNVSVSDSYPVDEAVGQLWADYFAALVHGSELELLHVFIATPTEVHGICGSPYAIGCYGANQMTMIGEPDFGVDPKEVAAHEYGHHIAHNRVNPPWLAEDWGTKRWSSYAGICTRTAQGTAFPGDEDTNYRLNPGEAFAEVYRTLVDSRRGAAFDWSIVDSSFIPNTTALKAVEDDVLHRWTTPTSRFVQGRFRVGGPKLWKLVLSTPLDGALDVALTVPRGGLYNLTVLGPDGRTVLATGLWSGTSQKRLTYTICGQRLLELRVARVGVAGRFSVRYAQP